MQGKLKLCGGKAAGGIDDAEAFCADILRRANLDYGYHEAEDALDYLITECWLLSRRYEPGRIDKGFSTFAGITLRKRLVDYDQRIRRPRLKWQFKDRTYERAATHIDSLDRVGGPEPSGTVDGPESGDPDFARVFGAGSSTGPRQENGLGKRSSRKAA